MTGRAVKGIRDVPRAARRAREPRRRRARPTVLEAALERSGYLAELEAEHRSRPRAGSRTSPSWSARPGEFETVDEFLEQVSLVADTDELDDDESLGRAHDPALGQGPRVPGRVPRRHGGRRVPPPALARRARRARGGAPPRLRRHHPGPRAALPHQRLEPHAVRRHAVQPAEPVPRRDPRPSSCEQRRPTGRAASGAGVGPATRRLGAGDGPTRRRRRAATRIVDAAIAEPDSEPPPRPRAPSSSASRSATTSATPSGARA